LAADASLLVRAIRACDRTRSPASADQRLFALYLPQAELTVHACVHSAATSERATLVEALDRLHPQADRRLPSDERAPDLPRAAVHERRQMADPGFTRASNVLPPNLADSFLAMRSLGPRAAADPLLTFAMPE
jgi:hypothetical protein